jgi:hypothetical protein
MLTGGIRNLKGWSLSVPAKGPFAVGLATFVMTILEPAASLSSTVPLVSVNLGSRAEPPSFALDRADNVMLLPSWKYKVAGDLAVARSSPATTGQEVIPAAVIA